MESLSPTTLPLFTAAENSTVTDGGLIVKNTARIASVRARMEFKVVANFHAYQVCRTIRRDFNLVSSKMYMRCSDKALRGQIQDLLMEVQIQAENLRSDCVAFGANPQPDIRTVDLRLVSPEAAQLHRSFMIADETIGRLNFAYKNKTITMENIEVRIEQFYQAYTDLKLFVVGGRRSDKTAAELGSEGGIS